MSEVQPAEPHGHFTARGHGANRDQHIEPVQEFGIVSGPPENGETPTRNGGLAAKVLPGLFGVQCGLRQRLGS